MKTVDAIIYTPTDIQELIRRKIDSLINEDNLMGIVIVEGILGELKDGKYNIFYGVSLRDTIGGLIPVNIPKSIVDKGYQGKEVIVSGILKAKLWGGKLDFFIDVSKIDLKTEISKEVLEKEKTLSEFLTSYKKYSRAFPDKDNYIIAVIVGNTSQVKSDFSRQLEAVEGVSIQFYPVNIVNVDKIVEAISEIQADIVVILRGGGSDGEFDVFNDIKLLEAWVSKDTYKISALGHTEHRTYLDIFSDVSCDTPTDAGVFIKQNIEKLRNLKEYQRLVDKHKEDVKALTEEYNKKLQELQKAKEEDSKALNEKMLSMQKELTEKFELKEASLRKNINLYRWVTFAEAVILVGVIVYILLS